MKVLPFLALTLIVSFSASTLAEVIKWVDENGRVHYGDRVPDEYKKDSTQLDIKTTPSQPNKTKKPITAREYFSQQKKLRQEEEEENKIFLEQQAARAKQEKEMMYRSILAKKHQEQPEEQDPCITIPQSCVDKHIKKFNKQQKRIREAFQESYLQKLRQ